MNKYQFILATLTMTLPYIFNNLSFEFRIIKGKISLIIKFGKKNIK